MVDRNNWETILEPASKLWGLEFKNPSLLQAGLNNLNIDVQAADQRYVLRVYKNYTTMLSNASQTQYELCLVDWLVRHGFTTPGPIKLPDGKLSAMIDDEQVALFPFIEGAHVEEPTLQQLGEISTLAAKLHLLTKEFDKLPGQTETELGETVFRRLDINAQPDIEGWEVFSQQAKLFWHESATQRQLISQLPHGIIHHDFHASNLIFNRHGITLLDFGECRVGPYALELAYMAQCYTLREDWSMDRGRFAAIVAGYEQIRQLNQAEMAALPFLCDLVNWGEAIYYLTTHDAASCPTVEDCHSYCYWIKNMGQPWPVEMVSV